MRYTALLGNTTLDERTIVMARRGHRWAQLVSRLWPLLVLVAGCSVTIETEPSPPAEVAPPAEVSEPEAVPPTTCELLLEAVVQDPIETELPGSLMFRFESKPDPALIEEHGWHPKGLHDGEVIRVWPDLHESPEDLEFTIAHEMAHLIDWWCLSDEDREAWIEHRGLGEEWYTTDPWASPHEDFADALAVCITGDPRGWVMDGAVPDQEACSLLSSLVGLG